MLAQSFRSIKLDGAAAPQGPEVDADEDADVGGGGGGPEDEVVALLEIIPAATGGVLLLLLLM